MQFGHIIPLVPSSFALRYISIMPSLYLRYTSVIPPLCLRFINGGRSSSQRRMIEFTTEDDRVHYEGGTKNERRDNGEGNAISTANAVTTQGYD